MRADTRVAVAARTTAMGTITVAGTTAMGVVGRTGGIALGYGTFAVEEITMVVFGGDRLGCLV